MAQSVIIEVLIHCKLMILPAVAFIVKWRQNAGIEPEYTVNGFFHNAFWHDVCLYNTWSHDCN